jgi:hypothetical protein
MFMKKIYGLSLFFVSLHGFSNGMDNSKPAGRAVCQNGTEVITLFKMTTADYLTRVEKLLQDIVATRDSQARIDLRQLESLIACQCTLSSPEISCRAVSRERASGDADTDISFADHDY